MRSDNASLTNSVELRLQDALQAEEIKGWRPVMRRRIPSILRVFLFISLLTPHHPAAWSEEGEKKPSRVKKPKPGLVLKGTGTLWYAWVVKVYTARLCGSPEIPASNLLKKKGPVRLEINYNRAIDRDLIVKSANAILKEQLPPNRLATLRERIEKLHLAYRDIGPGDSYWLDYIPNRGTALLFNGKEIERIPGWDFAQAYFGIWLADPPISKSLKSKLLESEMKESIAC